MSAAVVAEPVASPADLVAVKNDELISDLCPECGELIEGRPRGTSSLAWKMGQHRRNKHGVKGQGKKGRPKAGQPTDADWQARPVISAAQEAAAQIGGKGTPNADQLGAGLGRLLGLGTLCSATLILETDPTIPRTEEGERLRDQLAEYLTLADADAKAIMHPVGRMLAPTKINQKYGRAVVDNVDVLASLAAVVQLGFHYRDYFRARTQYTRQMATQAAPQGVFNAPPAPGPVPAAAVVEPDGLVHTAPPTDGVVWTPDMVAQMHAQKANA